jgi:hypothetical protein
MQSEDDAFFVLQRRHLRTADKRSSRSGRAINAGDVAGSSQIRDGANQRYRFFIRPSSK